MSKYIVLKKAFEPTCLGSNRYTTYSIFCHTNTKYPDNKSYWSTNVCEASAEIYAVDKDQIDSLLHEAQHLMHTHRKVPYKSTKSGEVFVLKVNSPKLKSIIASEREAGRFR